MADAPGILVAGNVAGIAPEAVRIGDEVQVVFEVVTDPKTGEQLRIPQWEIIPAASPPR